MSNPSTRFSISTWTTLNSICESPLELISSVWYPAIKASPATELTAVPKTELKISETTTPKVRLRPRSHRPRDVVSLLAQLPRGLDNLLAGLPLGG